MHAEPRLPEHCVQFAAELAWGDSDYGNPFGSATPLDPDNPDHMQWVYEVALKRAQERGIEGVTLQLAQGVVKNIVPAIAATNALVAAACANEAFKYVTGAAAALDNIMMYNGASGIYTYAFQYPRNERCGVCSAFVLTAAPTMKLRELIDCLVSDPHLFVLPCLFSS